MCTVHKQDKDSVISRKTIWKKVVGVLNSFSGHTPKNYDKDVGKNKNNLHSPIQTSEVLTGFNLVGYTEAATRGVL